MTSIRRAAKQRRDASSLAEALLRVVGVHHDLAAEVLGDLSEEFALRKATVGEHRARAWYCSELIRSMPHLGLSVVRNRCNISGSTIAMVMAFNLALFAMLMSDGPPALLTTGRDGDFIVNSTRPVRLAMQVSDAAGHPLRNEDVRYQWVSGNAVEVSSGGIFTCTQAGDAIVRATVGSLVTPVSVRCRPVKKVQDFGMIDVIVGDDAKALPVEATDSAGHRVMLLSGQITVGDSTIATADGQRLRARAPGATWVKARVGDGMGFGSVHAYERVARVEGILEGERFTLPVRLAHDELRHWILPAGRYVIIIRAHADATSRPQLAVAGAKCEHALDHLSCVARDPISVIAYAPPGMSKPQTAIGDLFIWRRDNQ